MNLDRRARPLFIYLLFLSISLPVRAQQAIADSLSRVVFQLPEQQQVTYINEHFTALYSRHFGLAAELGRHALDLCRKYRWTGLEARTLKNMGILSYLQGDYTSALEQYQQALDKFEQLDDRSGQGDVLKEMGNYFKKLNRYDKALEELGRAIRLCSENRDTNCLTAALDIQGVVLIEQGRLAEAEAIFTKELALLEHGRDDNALSYTLNNLAEVAIEQERFQQAEQYLARSTEIRLRLGDSTGVAININNLGEMFLKAGQATRALPMFEEAVKRATAIGFTDLQRHAMEMLSDTYAALGRHETAIHWLQKSYDLKDSLFNVESSRQVTEMAEKYEAEKREKELALQQTKLQRRNALLALTVAGLIGLALVFGFVYRQQQLKNNQIKREAELKTELVRAELSNRLQLERLRISRDLHDNLGAELTIISSTLAGKARQAPSVAEKVEIERIGNSARLAMSQLRETIWAIRHEQFSLQDLADKVNDFAARAGALPLQIILPDSEVKLSPAQTLNLYRIAQEAITNAVKYASASTLELQFRCEDTGRLSMSIADDGTGFDPNSNFAGHGLENLSARAMELGGRIEINSAAGKGTRITALIPFAGNQL